MKSIILILLLTAMALAVGPVNAWRADDNGVLYVRDWLSFEVDGQDAGLIGYRETALGADTLYFALDLDEDSCQRAVVFLKFTADASTGNYAATKTTRNIALYWVPELTYTARTVTAGNKLPISNMNSAGDILEYVYRTFTPDSASYVNKYMLDNISGRTGESTGWLGPFWFEASDSGDSTMSGLYAITADTVGLSWQALVILRE